MNEIGAHVAASLLRRFRLVRRLGAMGTVILAEQIAVGNRPVALKVLNRKLLDDPDFLLDILEAAKLAAAYASTKTKEEFLRDTQSQDAVIQRLEIIGEAARRISDQTRARLPGLP
jgi:hypothetical protein